MSFFFTYIWMDTCGVQTDLLLLSINSQPWQQVESHASATRFSIAPWHLGILSALLALFDVFLDVDQEEGGQAGTTDLDECHANGSVVTSFAGKYGSKVGLRRPSSNKPQRFIPGVTSRS